ncbi:MAG TPA: hypothetical protein VIL86_07975 [Tepidisphaeraceae bacterium]|jgi:PBP1b-binding outer membrane lipoprotein LpoB
MLMGYKAMLTAGLMVGLAGAPGCRHTYEEERPPVGQLDRRDRGLQSKDLLTCTDEMAASILGSADLARSDRQWIIVSVPMDNETSHTKSYDIFIDSLKTQIAKQGRGRATLVANKAKFNEMRNKELDQPGGDEFQQGGGRTGSNERIQADYFLNGKVQNLPNRGTDTFRFEFSLTNSKTGVQIWQDDYIVIVAR